MFTFVLKHKTGSEPAAAPGVVAKLLICVPSNEPLSLKESAYSQSGLSARELTGALAQNSYVINDVVLFWDTAEVTTRGV